MTNFKPTNAAEVEAVVKWAAGRSTPIEVRGHGSRRGVGRPAQTEHLMELWKLTGVTLYEPAELVLSARAGTPIAVIERMLTENGQEFAFEPADYGPLFGRARGRGTIGGVLAGNISGPRRIKSGAARDHILGISAVSGRGETFKSGGRVVKNVTGYDLSKTLAGSWGTLAVVTDVTFKVLPAAETETTLVLRGLPEEMAAPAMAIALGSSADVSGAAHLPETVAARFGEGTLGAGSATLLRLEGFGPSVAFRVNRLKELFGKGGGIDIVTARPSRRLWRDIRDCVPFADGTEKPVWRVSMTPTEAPKMVAELRREAAVDAFYDWGGGLAWLRMDAEPEHEALRRLVRKHGGGHATLIRASATWRAAVPVFQPQAPALAALSARLKAQFDPNNVLNPGRMTAS